MSVKEETLNESVCVDGEALKTETAYCGIQESRRQRRPGSGVGASDSPKGTIGLRPMASLFKLSVVAPDRTVFDDEVTSLVAPGVEGYLGVMAGHEPAIIALCPGVLEIEDRTGQREHVAIAGGFLEVSSGQAIVLADNARLAKEIDIADEQQALEQSRRALRGEDTEITQEVAQHELELAMARIKAAKMGGSDARNL